MSKIPSFMQPKPPTDGSAPSLRKAPVVAFAAPSVAKDRYLKQIKEKDSEKAGSQYVRSGAAGALLGLGLRRKGGRGIAAAKGAAAGLALQGATRIGTARTKDAFGDRSSKGKLVDKLPAAGLAGAALMAGSPRLRRKLSAVKTGAKAAVRRAASSGPRFVGEVLREVGRGVVGLSIPRISRDALIHGGALAGGIAIADGVTSGATAKKGERAHAVKEGLGKGALYGTTLAIAEPLLAAGLSRRKRPAIRSRSIVPLKARIPVIAFRGREQLYTDDHPTAKRVFADPLKVASGEQSGYTVNEHGQRRDADYGVMHRQVLGAAYRKGRTAYKWGSRTGSLANDLKDAAKGERKVDSRGRPLKREWEKSYFRNAVGSAAVAGGMLLHARTMRRNPGYRRKVQNVTRAAKERANRVVPDLFPLAAKSAPILFSKRTGRPVAFARVNDRIVAFDWSAPRWDVRDERGRSARVFAPGAQARDRREKHWHEKTANIRKIAIGGAVLAAAGGGFAGYKIGQKQGVKAVMRQRAQKAAATRRANVAAGAAAEEAAINRMKGR